VVKTRIDPIDRDIRVTFPDLFDAKQRTQALAQFARQALKEGIEQNRRVLGNEPPHETYVDGRRGASEDTVKPDGRIIYEFELMEELFTWIDEQLLTHSPWKTGRYTRSHVMVVDGRIAELTAIAGFRDEVFFANTQPYARKIERGLSSQAPDGVYQVVAQMASRRFGNFGRIRFGYRSLNIGGIHEWASKTGMTTKRGRDRADWLRRQPAIIITSKG